MPPDHRREAVRPTLSNPSWLRPMKSIVCQAWRAQARVLFLMDAHLIRKPSFRMRNNRSQKLKRLILKLYDFSALCDHGCGPPSESSFCPVATTAERRRTWRRHHERWSSVICGRPAVLGNKPRIRIWRGLMKVVGNTSAFLPCGIRKVCQGLAQRHLPCS